MERPCNEIEDTPIPGAIVLWGTAFRLAKWSEGCSVLDKREPIGKFYLQWCGLLSELCGM